MIAAYIEGNRFDQSFLPLAQSMAKLSDTDGDGQIARPVLTAQSLARSAFAGYATTGSTRVSISWRNFSGWMNAVK